VEAPNRHTLALAAARVARKTLRARTVLGGQLTRDRF